jgi:hypothetical protein
MVEAGTGFMVTDTALLAVPAAQALLVDTPEVSADTPGAAG